MIIELNKKKIDVKKCLRFIHIYECVIDMMLIYDMSVYSNLNRMFNAQVNRQNKK